MSFSPRTRSIQTALWTSNSKALYHCSDGVVDCFRLSLPSVRALNELTKFSQDGHLSNCGYYPTWPSTRTLVRCRRAMHGVTAVPDVRLKG